SQEIEMEPTLYEKDRDVVIVEPKQRGTRSSGARGRSQRTRGYAAQTWDAGAAPTGSNMREERKEVPSNGTDTNFNHRESVESAADGNVLNISSDSRFTGRLRFQGTVVVEGEVEGEIEARRVVIRETGKAAGTISSDSILIAGSVTGDVITSGEVEM